MVANRKVTGKAMSMPAGLGLGVGIGLGLTLVASAFVAYLVLTEKIAENSIGYCSIGILLIASALGALISARCIKHRWMPVCLGAGALYYLLLLAITALFFGGQYQGMGVTALLILAGSGCVGLLRLRGEQSQKGSGRKHRMR